MGDYFDDEDLINEYMEQQNDDELPPGDEYEQAFLEAELQDNTAGGAATKSAANNKDAVMMDENVGPLHRNEQQEQDVAIMEEPAGSVDEGEMTVPRCVSVKQVMKQQAKEDVYSFERYQGGWRTNKATSSSDAFTATEWKSSNSRHDERCLLDTDDTSNASSRFKRWEGHSQRARGNIKPSAPDAQLVEFWNQRHSRLHPRYKIALSSKTKSSVNAGGTVTMVSVKPIEGSDCIAMTLGDGTRVHVLVRTKSQTTRAQDAKTDTDNSSTKALSTAATDCNHLLGHSMTELFRRSDAILRKAEEQKQQNNRRRPTPVDADVVADDDEEEDAMDVDDKQEEKEHVIGGSAKKVRFQEHPPAGQQTLSSIPTKHDTDSHLWVDKHAPSEFSHLLSEERTNREVLRALRAWDPYVFRKEAPLRPTFVRKKQEESEQAALAKNNGNKGGENGTASSTTTTEKQVNDIRPDEASRIILLSGPPGIAKTTLAHIIARHAGYRPMEVNASDERSSAILKDRVIRAMESSTLNLKSKSGKKDELAGRPNCIILDEVDGADAKGAIGSLVEIIRAEIPPPGSKGGKNKTYLRRPIIFICNHKYSPALRPLLPFAKQFDMAPPSPTRLIARLRSVLSAEGLSVFGGSSLLNQLVNGTGGDIRSCLYTLQFASARARELDRKKREKEQDSGKGNASMVDISSSLKAALGGTGLKDERSDASGTITAVFRKAKEQKPFGTSSIRSRGKRNRVERILQLIENYGDDSKTLDCVFTNLLQVSYVDPTLDRCTLAHDWLSSTDVCQQRNFMPAAAAAVHLLCRVETRQKLTFSNRRMVDARYQLEANDNLAEKFVEGLAPGARAGATKGTAAIETVPFSLWMLSAGGGSSSLSRGVSSIEILNKNERLAFDAHVATLRSLGLTYVARDDASMRAYGDNSSVAMRLEPQIDRLIQFDDLSLPPGGRRRYIPHVLKELLAHNAAIEGMRAVEKKADAQKASSSDASSTVGLRAFGREEVAFKTAALKDSKDAAICTPSPLGKQKLGASEAAPPAKRSKIGTLTATKASANFLGLGAAKAKAARMARKAAQVGFDKSKRLKVSNSGSNVPFDQVIRFKYQKGFTQAVRTPCKMEDII